MRGEICRIDDDCCEYEGFGDHICRIVVSGAKRCRQAESLPCQESGDVCAVSEDCCSGLCIQDEIGVYRCIDATCMLEGERCSSTDDCCEPLVCFDLGDGSRCYLEQG